MSDAGDPMPGTGIPSSETKYGDQLPDDGTKSIPDEPTTSDEPEPYTEITSHEVEVIYHTDPTEDEGYGREKYTARVRYDDATGEPYVLLVVEHRWKGNYWRDVTDWDWRDVPDPVREEIADRLPVDGPEALATTDRLIDEGGESRWEKHHAQRVQALDGDQMWGLSYLRDAHRDLESAAEAFADGSTAETVTEKVLSALQTAIEGVDERGDGGD